MIWLVFGVLLCIVLLIFVWADALDEEKCKQQEEINRMRFALQMNNIHEYDCKYFGANSWGEDCRCFK